MYRSEGIAFTELAIHFNDVSTYRVVSLPSVINRFVVCVRM
jgi:hypothetical protein